MILNSKIKNNISQLPEKPGVYQFCNQAGEILYIGKAKNIRKRVSSYFSKNNSNYYKQEILVNKIYEIRYILVENESDALLLENNLIKEFKPKYNILLKDDKTFPWICIKNESFPKVFYTRKIVPDGSEYFGPYTSVTMIKTLFSLIRKLYKIRTCNYALNQDNISKKKYKRCLEYDLGNCKAPCEGLQSETDYNASIQQIREILKGNLQLVMNHLYQNMQQYAKEHKYEKAQLIKQKIERLDHFRARSTIVNPKINNVEVYSIIDEKDFAYVNFLKLVKGAIVQAQNLKIVKRIEEKTENVLSYVIYDMRERLKGDATEIIVPIKLDIAIRGVVFTVPKKGDKKKLLDLSFRNANSYRIEMAKTASIHKIDVFEKSALESIKNELRLKVIPDHMECIDISNIMGNEAVASCVVFKSGKPSKSEYRHYHIKTVTGANDYASIEEILRRRCRYFKDHQLKLPDLFVIDGGKGQLNAALKAMKTAGFEKGTAIISIAKRLEEIYIPGDPLPLYLNKNSQGLKLIQRIRDEAHRFGISFHRNKRSKSMLESELDQIKGIGNITKSKLFGKSRNLETIRKMSLDELEAIAGKKAGRILFENFHTQS